MAGLMLLIGGLMLLGGCAGDVPTEPAATVKSAATDVVVGGASAATHYFLAPSEFGQVPNFAPTLSSSANSLQGADRLMPFYLQDGPRATQASPLAVAQEAFAAGRFAEAAEEFRTVLRESPGDLNARLGLAVLLMSDGHHAQALPHLDRVIQQHPDDPRGYLQRSTVAFEQRRWRPARDDLRKTIELGLDTPAHRARLGMAHLHLKDWPEAEREATLAIEGDAGLPEAYFVRCLARAQQRDEAGARADFTQAASLDLEPSLLAICEQAVGSFGPSAAAENP